MGKRIENPQLSKRYTKSEIEIRVKELAREISHDFTEKQLAVVGVLSGAFVFLADLIRHLSIPCSVQFVDASSYGSSMTSSGRVELTHSVDVRGKDILIVEDILDTGRTLHRIFDELSTQQPKSIRICTLLDKPARRETQIRADYVGFTVPNVFVVGYGIDFAEDYRQLPYIAELKTSRSYNER